MRRGAFLASMLNELDILRLIFPHLRMCFRGS